MKLMHGSVVSTDPLSFLLDKYGYDFSLIRKIVSGEKYLAVLLENGNIGVCATLGNILPNGRENYKEPDLKSIQGRIALNAYFCSILNYQNDNFVESDVFDFMDFKNYKQIVMVGYFDSLLKKFERENIPLSIFDMKIENSDILPETEKVNALKHASALILTSTSVFNNTFYEVIKHTPENCDVFMLGPSSIMATDLFQYRNIRVICGSVFEKFDDDVLKVIENHGGTKDFLKAENKKVMVYT